MSGLDGLSPADLEALVTDSGAGANPTAAWAELRERAEAGDTASRKVIAKLEKAGHLEAVPDAESHDYPAGREGLTLPGIADRLLTMLGEAVLQTDRMLTAEAIAYASEDHGRELSRIRDLSAAFRDVDAVLARIRADEPAALAPTLEAFLTAAWDESQKAGVAIDVADQVVGKLRLRLAANG